MLKVNRKQEVSFSKLLRRIHRDQEGSVSIETILIIAAVAIPILIFIVKIGWPRVRAFFEHEMDNLEGSVNEDIEAVR